MRNIVERICKACCKTFQIDYRNIKYGKKIGKIRGQYCSTTCSAIGHNKQKQVQCLNCQIFFIKKNSELTRSKNNFCGSSCSATYNNKHKTKGIRRSKLEIFIEEKIKNEFPDLKLITNKLDIGYELDFYFPDLKLAIEINGIFHYKPIFGKEKLLKIQANDKDKKRLCKKNKIKLFTYKDKFNRFTKANGEKCWKEIRKIILSHI